jgi:hypothetical protein
MTKDTVRSELVLRLTDEQIAAIRARNQRRTRKIVECGQIDRGNISPADGSDLMQACMEAVAPIIPSAPSAPPPPEASGTRETFRAVSFSPSPAPSICPLVPVPPDCLQDPLLYWLTTA